jgi:hypothetical protein
MFRVTSLFFLNFILISAFCFSTYSQKSESFSLDASQTINHPVMSSLSLFSQGAKDSARFTIDELNPSQKNSDFFLKSSLVVNYHVFYLSLYKLIQEIKPHLII